jgi:hypothetical protein
MNDLGNKHKPPTLRLWVQLACCALGLLVSLPSCVSVSSTRAETIDIAELKIDAAECLRITLRDDVRITAQTIEENMVLPGQAMVILQYVELKGGDVAQIDQKRDYANIYLVSNVQIDAHQNTMVKYRYLVTELWRFYPEKGIKICLQWMVWEEQPGEPASKATLRVLIEDYKGRFIVEHSMKVEEQLLKELRAYYARMKETFREKVQGTLILLNEVASACSPAEAKYQQE